MPSSGGPLGVEDVPWAWVYPLRSIAGPVGQMVVYAAEEPTPDERFLAIDNPYYLEPDEFLASREP